VRQRGTLGRLVARLTGRWHLERLEALDEKVGSYGRAHREALAAQRSQLDQLREAVEARAGAHEVRALTRRIESVELLLDRQDRLYSAALERADLLDAQAAAERRLARRMQELLRHERPIIIGPWTGEVGFELIYWVPFVRWAVSTYRIPKERLIVVSRGGTASWYGDMATRYADAFEFVSPEEFRAATAEARKQRRVGAFDAELVRRVVAAHRLERPDLLHPGLMYRLFMPLWKELASAARIRQYTIVQSLQPPEEMVGRELPSDYVAARFYFNDCFPDTAANREFIRTTIDGISRESPVILLNTPFHVDDHRDAPVAADRVTTIGAHVSPSRNLAVQTAVIARARAFVGTYGGYAYLAPLLGVNALSFYSAPTFKTQHLHVAQHIFEQLGGPALVALDVSAVSALRLSLWGSLAATP
jgi:hypothetical protein